MNPLVSIGMPLYNEEKHLEETLACLLKQDYDNFEIVISDNASVDRTGEICRKFEALDSRIRYHRLEKTIDASENFNHVFSLTKGEYFMMAAGHDRYDPTFIGKCVRALIRDPSVVLSFCQIVPMTDDGKSLPPLHAQVETLGPLGPILRYLLVFWNWGGWDMYGIFRSSALKQTDLYRHNTIGTDYVLLGQLALLGPFSVVREPLFYIRLNWHTEKTLNDTLLRYTKTMFHKQKRGRWWFPMWRYFYEHIDSLVRAKISLKRKSILIPATVALFLAKNHGKLAGDLIRPFTRFPQTVKTEGAKSLQEAA